MTNKGLIYMACTVLNVLVDLVVITEMKQVIMGQTEGGGLERGDGGS